jgi:hypothetical protein
MFKYVGLIFILLFSVSCTTASFLETNSKELAWDWQSFPLQVKYTELVNQRTVKLMEGVIEDLNYRLKFKAVFPHLLPFELSIADMDIDHSKLGGKLWLTHVLVDDSINQKLKVHSDIKRHNVTGEIFGVFLYVKQDYDIDMIETHLRHELGHVLGLAHSTNPFSVMYEHAYGGLKLKDFDEEDIKLLRKKYLGGEQ